jgi:chemotaxis protein methyltransferase CheR
MTPSGSPARDGDAAALARLRKLVLGAGGIDLGLYKSRCLERRIAVRQRVSGAADLPAYAALVRRDPVERRRLVQALTIHVSQFFRNPSCFHAIRRDVLPVILQEKCRRGARALRAWSVGCACGEEAYSLALLLTETAPQALADYSCAVYGTDIEPTCLSAAREARYPAASLAHVPPAWRQRHFTPVDGRWELGPAVRELVTFRRHNILDPPPFSRIDLAVFRNVLIYMTSALQERILLALHEVLVPGGFLVLGKVEGLVGAAQGRFAPVNVGERIYRRAD